MRVVRAGNAFHEAAADALERALVAALRNKPRVSLALSGGQTPRPAFRLLARAALDWKRIDVFQVDERVAPAGHSARNLTGLSEALLDRVAATVHPMPVEEDDLDSAALRYADALPEALDVVHLGLGDDGHTGSLIPGDPALGVTHRTVAVTRPYRGHRRMTLTFPALDGAAVILWVVSSTGKAWALQRLRDADPSIPAGRVSQGQATLVTDEETRSST